MSKASMAQEPSMDEILASIRRIIETGDEKTGQARPTPRPMPGFDASFVQVAAERDAPAAPLARNEPASGPDDTLTAQLETELAASWDELAEAPPLGEAVRSDSPDGLDVRADADRFDAAPTRFSVEDSSPSRAVPADPDGEDELARFAARHADPAGFPSLGGRDDASFSPANTDRPGTRAETAYGEGAFGYGTESERLLSEASGALVASSFEELAHAIRAGELRSIEAMAQEMLRPMLREWLDDNLPHMVERLVREEIERMARGGHR